MNLKILEAGVGVGNQANRNTGLMLHTDPSNQNLKLGYIKILNIFFLISEKLSQWDSLTRGTLSIIQLLLVSSDTALCYQAHRNRKIPKLLAL